MKTLALSDEEISTGVLIFGFGALLGTFAADTFGLLTGVVFSSVFILTAMGALYGGPVQRPGEEEEKEEEEETFKIGYVLLEAAF